jgi:hypothetical protein
MTAIDSTNTSTNATVRRRTPSPTRRASVMSATAALMLATMLGVAACGGSSNNLTAAGSPNNVTNGSSTGGSSGGGRCSDPNPDNLALTFAAVVCVESQTSARQSDGSTELEVRVTITDKDPNAFNVRTTDFKVLDAVGHDVDADPPAMPGRSGTSDCIAQSLADDGWPVGPGKSFTVPGPICFNLQAGEQARQLVWQDDVPVNLG